jgi:hypothetical protein
MLFVSIQELEAAINYWRAHSPSRGDELILSKEASSLAKPYALMIIQGAQRIPLDMLDEACKESLAKFMAWKSQAK